jgi:hypothetical protein
MLKIRTMIESNKWNVDEWKGQKSYYRAQVRLFSAALLLRKSHEHTCVPSAGGAAGRKLRAPE